MPYLYVHALLDISICYECSPAIPHQCDCNFSVAKLLMAAKPPQCWMAYPGRGGQQRSGEIPSLAGAGNAYNEESGDPLVKINEENRRAAITKISNSPTAH